MIKLTSLIAEVTDMIFLVAKTVEPKDKELAMKIADYLNKQGIVARAKYPARFGLTKMRCVKADLSHFSAAKPFSKSGLAALFY